MNFKLVLRVVGRVLFVECAAMVLPLVTALYYGESPAPFAISIQLLAAMGVLLSLLPARDRRFYAREGFFSVGLIWLLVGLGGALPFWLSGQFASFADCVFESFSGFTTTGASILTDIEACSRGILFWRAFTHWLGGMGILVLVTAVVPALGIPSHYLAQAESPGPTFSKLVPKQSQTSKILYTIYGGLSLAELLCLKLAGMPLYDALIHTFSSAGTGGFSNRNASVGAYGSVAVDLIISVFVLLFSVNFALYFLVLTKRWKEALKSDELRFFFLVVASATLLIGLNIRSMYPNLLQALRYAFFQVTSIISTTGFSTTDWLQWPSFSQLILILLMFCGACAGSTGGGMKCSRILLLLRAARREMHQIIHPTVVETVRLEGRAVDEDTLRSTLIFIGCYLATILTGALAVSLENAPFDVAFTAALTCVSNVGPGLDFIGPVGSFAPLSAPSKLVLSACMVIGRLEIMPILVLFSRGAWKRT